MFLAVVVVSLPCGGVDVLSFEIRRNLAVGPNVVEGLCQSLVGEDVVAVDVVDTAVAGEAAIAVTGEVTQVYTLTRE